MCVLFAFVVLPLDLLFEHVLLFFPLFFSFEVCQPQPFGAFFHAGGPLSYPTSYPAVVDVSQPAYPSGVVTVPVVAGSPYQARVLADPRALHQSNRKAVSTGKYGATSTVIFNLYYTYMHVPQ